MKHLLFHFIAAWCLIVDAYGQRVLPGDYPDPSVVRIGETFWATATTSNWAPVFPLLHSDDLINWEMKGFVFENIPAWADYYFWAPEISYDNGKTWIYYSAHKRNGNLCLAAASADRPEGPYTDHGPIMCQEAGSIDAYPIRDSKGKLFMIWKEDGNSVGKPTPIWISEMKEDRSGLIGEKKELFRNDQPWEANLVEGVSIVQEGEYYYAFYAAAGCCGRGCTYATGVARARDLSGPWEKDPGNPVLVSDEKWICPGHGTPVKKDGRNYFLYHAYEKGSNVFTGRQGLLKEFRFTKDGWITFDGVDAIPDVKIDSVVHEKFTTPGLSPRWQWSVFGKPEYRQRNGELTLHPLTGTGISMLGQKTLTGNYRTEVTVNTKKSDAGAGLVAIGDEKNLVAVTVTRDKLVVWKREDGKETVLYERKLAPVDKLVLRMAVLEGSNISFSWKDGDTFIPLNDQPVSGAFLPPWDRAVRAGIISKGQNEQKAVFENFILYH